MPDDLVERVRAGRCTAGCNSAPVCLCAKLDDAAAEIERLRAWRSATSARIAELEAALRPFAERARTRTIQVAAAQREPLQVCSNTRACSMDAAWFIEARRALEEPAHD